MTDSQSHLRCHICDDYAHNAVETHCCRQVFCKSCIVELSQNGKPCPKCKTLHVVYRCNQTARRQISEIEETCPNQCGETILKDSHRQHAKICKLRTYYCTQEDCTFAGFEGRFLEHMISVHRRLVLVTFSGSVRENRKSGDSSSGCGSIGSDYCTISAEGPSPSSRGVNARRTSKTEGLCAQNRDRNSAQTEGLCVQNRDGNSAQMGQNGKFYCGKASEVLKRKRQSDQTLVMEKGPCGPDRGSNCEACMALDVRVRKLPFGFLVNQNGTVCKPVACIHGKEEPKSGCVRPCNPSTCGNMPIYYCEKPHVQLDPAIGERKFEPKCHSLARCFACEILRYQLERNMYDNVWKNTYDHVWKKTTDD